MGMLLAGLVSCSAGRIRPNSSEGSHPNMVTKELSNVVNLESDQSFDLMVLQSPVPVIVDFWASWCGPCRRQSPIVDQLADQEGDRLRVVKVNVDDHEELAHRFDIRGIPTLIIFSQGKETTRLVGLHTLEQVKNAAGV
jgi:thioredoxin 1